MQKVPDIWYSRINFALGVGALLIALSFVVFKVFGIVDSTEVLGLTNVAVAGFAVVWVVFFRAQKAKTCAFVAGNTGT